MNMLVTGCAGFIGSQLTESLLDDGNTVVGVDCFNDNYARTQKLSNLSRARDWETFQFIPIDLARGDLDDLVDAADVIFHLAAEPGVRASWGARFANYLANNVIATQHILDSIKRYPGKRIVYASSSSVYGDAESLPTAETAVPHPFSPYGVTKLAAEHLCELYRGNYGVDAISLRYFSVYGPRQRPDMAFHIFAKAALRGERIPVFGDGTQTRDFTYVDDVVAATRLAGGIAEPKHRIYNIGGGSQVSLRDALSQLEVIVGHPLLLDHSSGEKGDVKDTGADRSRALDDLGFQAETPFAHGLSREFEWIKTEFG